MYIYIYTHIHTYIYIYIYILIYVYVYTYIYIYIYVLQSFVSQSLAGLPGQEALAHRALRPAEGPSFSLCEEFTRLAETRLAQNSLNYLEIN